MDQHRLRLAPGASVEPMYGDIDVDCRLLFMGDRYRQLQRAYMEAMFRLLKDRPLEEREAALRASADVQQYYEIERRNGVVALHLRDQIFYEQAPLEDLDLVLTASGAAKRVTVPLPLAMLKAASVLVSLLNGDYSETDVMAGLHARLDADDSRWAAALLAQWSDARVVTREPATPNRLLAPTERPRVRFLGHSSILLQSRRSAVLTDPVLRAPFGLAAPVFDVTRLTLGAICCSHSHWDHCDVATLLRFDKRTPIVVPRVRTPTIFNPPIASVLTRLGFTDIREVEIWDRIQIGDIEIIAVPFHGEQEEPGVEMDHFTYVLRTDGLSVYGGVDAYRDTFGEMLPALERVRREWAPDIAFLPVSCMRYAWRDGGVPGYCRDVRTDQLDEWFQYTASAEQAVAWARALGVRRVVPYATFTFSRFDIAPQAKEFDEALTAAGLGRLLLALRPFDAADAGDLTGGAPAELRRQGLLMVLRAGAAGKRLDARFKMNLAYRALKRVFGPRAAPLDHH